MAEIKLVASDLDGTLLTENKKITKRLMDALEKINSMGIYFVPSTGRVFDSLPSCVKELPFLKYAVVSNGAAVYDADEKRAVFENYLSADAVNITLEILEGVDAVIEIFMGGRAYIERKIYENLSSYGITEGHAQYILTTRTPVDDIYAEIEKNKSSLENINIIFNDMSLRLETWQRLKAAGHASVTSSAHNNIEVTSLKATKAQALGQLCDMLGIKRENVLAMGDSDNDLDMIKFAGVGVAMANGDEHIKQAADIITESCDNFGAAVILEKLIEKGEF